MVEEGQKCQAFAKEFLAALQACASEECWALMYPQQLLTGSIPLVTLLGMPAAAQLQATTDTGSIPAPLTLNALDTPMPQPSIRQQCHSSNQGMPDPGQDEEEAPGDTSEEPSHKKWKPMVKSFKEAQ